MRVSFEVHGTIGKGTVYLEMKKNAVGLWRWVWTRVLTISRCP
jgi:hypothetical protein